MNSASNKPKVRITQRYSKRGGEVNAHRSARVGRIRVGVLVLVGIVTVGLRARVNGVSAVILPTNESRCPLAEHPMGIQLEVRRCTVGQDEHQGEGTKECEDKFP